MGQGDTPGGEPITAGFLGSLPESAAADLLADALEINVAAGGEVYQGEEQPRVVVVREGLLRLYHRSLDGREVSVRYARSGDVLGLALVLGGPAPVTIQALTSASIMALRVSTLRRLVERDPAVAQACAAELARELLNAFDEIAGQAFLTVRQRVARQILDLAAHRPDGSLVSRVTQQELADAIGSTREVVSRAIRELKEAGLVATSRKGIVVCDPLRLREQATGMSRAASG